MFSEQKGKSLIETRRANRVLIKNAIYRDTNANRTSIARELGLTLATLSTAAGEMIRAGILEETKAETKEASGAGRKATILRFRSDAAYAIGIDVTFRHVFGVLINMNGRILKNVEITDEGTDYDSKKRCMIAAIAQLLPKIRRNLVGIGIGIPGYVDSTNGILKQPFFSGWERDIRIRDEISEHFGLPVIVNNNRQMRFYGYDMEEKSAVPPIYAYFYSYRRIACNIIRDGETLSGFSESGEIGYNAFYVDGTWKRFNDVASEYQMVEELRAAMKRGELRSLRTEMEKGGWIFEHAMKLYEDGEAEITPYVERVVKLNAVCASQMLNALNPGVIVCDSHLFLSKKSRDLFETYVKRCIIDSDYRDMTFLYRNDCDCVGAKGAALRVLKKLFLDV